MTAIGAEGVAQRWSHERAPFLGMTLFIVSEAFLFGSLFWTYYYLRAKSWPDWPPEGAQLELGLVTLNTVLLLTSSVTMHAGADAIRRGSRRGLVFGLAATLALGAAFLTITGWEWTHAPFRPWSHAYGSTFYTLTGFHGAHVLGGLGVLAALLTRARGGRFTAERHLAVDVGGLYWHFVDAVWIAVYSTIFLVR